MNAAGLTNELSLFFQTLPPKNLDLDKNFSDNFSNLFIRFISELPGEGFESPDLNQITVISLNDTIKDLFEESLKGIATSIVTPEVYCSKIGSALDSFISLLPEMFNILEPYETIIFPSMISQTLIQVVKPIFENPQSTSLELSNAIVQEFIFKVNSSLVVYTDSRITANWIAN